MTKKIVIVGAGFAGLSSYITLKKSGKCDLTLIDRKKYFEYTPSLALCLCY